MSFPDRRRRKIGKQAGSPCQQMKIERFTGQSDTGQRTQDTPSWCSTGSGSRSLGALGDRVVILIHQVQRSSFQLANLRTARRRRLCSRCNCRRSRTGGGGETSAQAIFRFPLTMCSPRHAVRVEKRSTANRLSMGQSENVRLTNRFSAMSAARKAKYTEDPIAIDSVSPEGRHDLEH